MVRVESDTEEGLKSQVRSIFDGAKGYSLEPIRLRYIQLDIRESFWLGGDPGVLNGLIFSGRLPFVYVPMEDVAQLPFFRVREDKNIGGIPIGEDIKTWRFMCRDLWNGNNYNSFMSGESGSWKSFAVKTLSVREYFSGARVLVVDPEGEFKKITEHIGGRYIDLVKTGIGAEKINPFDFSYPRSIIYSYGRAEVENNIMKYMNGFIVGLGDDAREIYGIETVFRREFLSPLAHLVVMICNQSHVDSRHFSKVEILLNDFFRAKFNISPGDPEPYFDMMNNPQSFKGFYSYLESLGDEDESIVAIRQGIYPYWYELGSKADIFSSTKTNISIDDQWVAFGLKGADEDAMSVLMYVVMTYIQNSIFAQKNLQKTRLVVDEAHTFTQNDPEVTAFIRKLVLRARKYFIGVTLVTQNISQLFGGSQNREMNNSLFANLTNYLFLAQKEIGIDEMMQYCKISAPEALFMRSITKAKQEYEILKDTGRGSTEFRGQWLFMSSSGTDTVKIICEPYIFDFINTDPQKKSAVEA